MSAVSEVAAEAETIPATAAEVKAAGLLPEPAAPTAGSASEAPHAVPELEAEGSTELAADEENGGDEINYGLSVDPDVAFDTAQAAAQQLHECLDHLVAGKVSKSMEGNDGLEAFLATRRTMQLQLLALRRAHRAMAKAADAGRLVELSARKVTDAEHAHLETRIYESTCCRAAARRCRNFPTPHLNELRPLLEGANEEGKGEEGEEGEEGDDGEEAGQEKRGSNSLAAGKGLAARLEAERSKRSSLFAELESLERQKAKDLDAFRDVARLSDELATRLRAVEVALEPVCNLLEYRPRPASAAQPSTEAVSRLSPPLQLVFAKFDVLAAFGPSSSVSLRIDAGDDGSTPPPEKRAKTDGTPAETQWHVCVEVAGPKALVLRFASPHPSLVTVAAEGEGGEALLDGLWPEDDGRNAGLVALLPASDVVGRPFAWAQILAGLRETLVAEAPVLQQADVVTAADVVLRLRARAAELSSI